jgi:hypothetical protein
MVGRGGVLAAEGARSLLGRGCLCPRLMMILCGDQDSIKEARGQDTGAGPAMTAPVYALCIGRGEWGLWVRAGVAN